MNLSGVLFDHRHHKDVPRAGELDQLADQRRACRNVFTESLIYDLARGRDKYHVTMRQHLWLKERGDLFALSLKGISIITIEADFFWRRRRRRGYGGRRAGGRLLRVQVGIYNAGDQQESDQGDGAKGNDLALV